LPEHKKTLTAEQAAAETREKAACGKCGALVDEQALTCFYNTELCPACLDKYTFTCADCDGRYWREDAYECSGSLICYFCYDSNYATCDKCDRIVHFDDVRWPNDGCGDEICCSRCYERELP
jgi:hypothetical protein